MVFSCWWFVFWSWLKDDVLGFRLSRRRGELLFVPAKSANLASAREIRSMKIVLHICRRTRFSVLAVARTTTAAEKLRAAPTILSTFHSLESPVQLRGLKTSWAKKLVWWFVVQFGLGCISFSCFRFSTSPSSSDSPRIGRGRTSKPSEEPSISFCSHFLDYKLKAFLIRRLFL